MTSWAVIDSGILLATVLIEQYSSGAKALMKSLTGRQIQIAVPVLFRYKSEREKVGRGPNI